VEIILGFAVGVSCAFVLGYSIAHSWLLEQTLSPYVVGFQAVPIVVIAPVLRVIFGPGVMTNAGIAALIAFFPMLISTIVGIRSVDPELRDLMRSLTATRWQMFTRLEIPSALPALFGGLKISATLAIAGAVVGEALGADAGLGFSIYSARYVYDQASVFVGIFTLTALALALYELIALVERRVLAWKRRGH
jgi:NitT/TauT family transport system permease protein